MYRRPDDPIGYMIREVKKIMKEKKLKIPDQAQQMSSIDDESVPESTNDEGAESTKTSKSAKKDCETTKRLVVKAMENIQENWERLQKMK